LLLCLALAALMQHPAGPIDAFRANLSSVKVGADFDCKIWNKFNPASLKEVFNFEPCAGPAGEPGYVIQGRWEYDGSSERYVVRVTGGSFYKPGARSGPMPSVEVLCDDETFAYHYLKTGEKSFRVHLLDDAFPIPLVGPFTWYSLYSFDRDLKVHYARISPARSKGERGGYPTEIEVYERSVGEFTVRVEVAYDPGVGYLPRFCRSIAYGMERGRSMATVNELYLVDTKPCAAGGFVPTEWYLIRYEIDDFGSKYPGYDEKTKLVVPSQSTVVHLKVNRLNDKKDRARLEELAGVNRILAPGGPVISKNDYLPMNLSEIKAAMGSRALKSNRPILANIDASELHEFDTSRRTNWTPYWLAGLALTPVVAFLIRRRSMNWVVLIALVPLNGCGQRPVPRLTAAFAQSHILYEPSQPSLNLDLIISNAGNQTLRIMKVDAGCSCRQVDPAQLPATVRPGERMKVAVTLSGGRSYNPETYTFSFLTDQGQLTAPVVLLSIPRHHLSPDSITMNGLDETSTDEVSGFDLVHREVYEPGSREPEVDLVVPAGFVKEDHGVHEGRVAGMPDLAFRDAKYHLTLKDHSLGLHRADIVIKGAGGRKLVEAPLVWKRLPFLSSAPDRVALTTRPARVFLRCPDESVELTRVLSSPPGVKAELDSPRSIRVTMTDDAPAVLQDFVEVGTTSVGSQTLRVPVVRYAAVATQPDRTGTPEVQQGGRDGQRRHDP
jgi:hypothetical protein